MSKTIERTINYFQINPIYQKGQGVKNFETLIYNLISYLNNNTNTDRIRLHNEKNLLVFNLDYNKSLKLYSGKILNIRKDAFPEIFDTKKDSSRYINANADEGISESTHFLIQFQPKGNILLSMEHNHYGPRISDLIYYLTYFTNKNNISKLINFIPISRDELSTFKSRINRISSITTRVHKSEIQRLKNVDGDLFNAYDEIQRFSDAEYMSVRFKYDIKNQPGTYLNPFRKKINDILSIFNKSGTSMVAFDKLIVRAEDSNNSNLMHDFDFLNIWYKSKVKATLQPKSRVVVTNDMISKMQNALIIENIKL